MRKMRWLGRNKERGSKGKQKKKKGKKEGTNKKQMNEEEEKYKRTLNK